MIYLEWSIKASENAISLSQEARILLGADKFARAFYLSHMASEEAAKSILLSSIHTLSTPESELSKVESLLRNHGKKIEFAIEMAGSIDKGLATRIKETENQLIAHINDLKNNSMYVSLIDGNLVYPDKAVKELDIESFVSYGEAIAEFSHRVLPNK